MPFRHLDGVSICRFHRGEYLIHRGERMEYVFYLIQGSVKREVTTAGGHIAVNTLKESGKITGSIVALFCIYDETFDGTSTDDFVAASDCICYRIPVDVCKCYLRAHPVLLEQALGISIGLFDETEAALVARLDDDAGTRFCRFLEKHSEKGSAGNVLPRAFTNVEIAKYLSMHTVTVSRLITALINHGSVKRMSDGLHVLDAAFVHECASGREKLNYRKISPKRH